MELEFDKEINAILRKAGGSGNVRNATAAAPHLDADTIAAFAENALPDKAKRPLLEHFADCDRCRKMLSQSILLNSEADATAASSVVSTPVAEAVAPWYQKLFKTSNLAFAMGGLVLVFSGVLGYLVLQNKGDIRSAQISQVNEPEASHGGPYFNNETEGAVANIAQPASSPSLLSPASNTKANSDASKSGMVSESAPATGGRMNTGEAKTEVLDDRAASSDATTGGASSGLAKPAPVAPPPPVIDGVMAEQDEKKLDSAMAPGRDKDMEPAKRKVAEDREGYRRDLPPPASKSGPVRSGPLQNQSNQVNNRAYDMSVSRSRGPQIF